MLIDKGRYKLSQILYKGMVYMFGATCSARNRQKKKTVEEKTDRESLFAARNAVRGIDGMQKLKLAKLIIAAEKKYSS